MARSAAPFGQTELEHKELRALSKELRQLLKEQPAEAEGDAGRFWDGISGRILELRDRLILHFAQEEREGLADLFTELQPHIADRSESLRGSTAGFSGSLGSCTRPPCSTRVRRRPRARISGNGSSMS